MDGPYWGPTSRLGRAAVAIKKGAFRPGVPITQRWSPTWPQSLSETTPSGTHADGRVKW